MTVCTKYPGDGAYYLICDVCGAKIRARDATRIDDKFNYLHGMVVCAKDVDETNPQSYVRAVKDHNRINPKIVRSEGTDVFTYIETAAQIEDGDTTNPSGRSPTAPLDLSIIGATSSQVEILWHGPISPGSGAISGYKIERESPVGGGFSTLVADTAQVSMYYKDTTVSATTQYNYRVSAINRIGTSSASNTAAVTTQ